MSGFSQDPSYDSQTSSYSSNNKKSRVTTACESCRTRKRRCNGVRPICGNCQEFGYECVWTCGQKRRGPPKGYLSNLESRAQASSSILGLLERFLETIPKDQWPSVERGIHNEDGNNNPGIWKDYPVKEPEKIVNWYRTKLSENQPRINTSNKETSRHNSNNLNGDSDDINATNSVGSLNGSNSTNQPISAGNELVSHNYQSTRRGKEKYFF